MVGCLTAWMKRLISVDALDCADVSGVQGASYDLLLGDEYYYAWENKKAFWC